jgi:hypothetical protein
MAVRVRRLKVRRRRADLRHGLRSGRHADDGGGDQKGAAIERHGLL